MEPFTACANAEEQCVEICDDDSDGEPNSEYSDVLNVTETLEALPESKLDDLFGNPPAFKKQIESLRPKKTISNRTQFRPDSVGTAEAASHELAMEDEVLRTLDRWGRVRRHLLDKTLGAIHPICQYSFHSTGGCIRSTKGSGFVWLIEQRGNPQTGQRFVAQPLDVIAGSALNGVEPFDFRFRITPLFGQRTTEEYVLQHIAPSLIGKSLPLDLRRDLGHPRKFELTKEQRLVSQKISGDDRVLQQQIKIGQCRPLCWQRKTECS